MSLLVVVIFSAICLVVAYFTYGSLLARWFKLDPTATTPAVELRDDLDYVPIAPKFLMGQHFSAIAAAGPIVGPILAGVMFGWVPALIWILVGSIFIGGVHDLGSLLASVRHKARSIAEVVKLHMSWRSYVLFLIFVWFTLIYVIVAFTDIVAGAFVGVQTLEHGERVTGGGIATSSLLYLTLPIVMGLLLRYTKLSLGWATVIFLPLVAVSIWVGQYIPLDLAAWLGISDDGAHKVWDVLLLGYCFVAALAPMWLLLQPRGHLGGYFLYAALLGGALGLVFSGKSAVYPAFIGWHDAAGAPMFPLLFITVACGACSGFHAIVSSGTTSKQLRKETDARTVGYGAMLLEGMVAVVSLCCVMVLARDTVTGVKASPNYIYSMGIGSFLETLGVPGKLAVTFALLAFTTFVYDTLDVCTRLGRYILEELFKLRGRTGRYLATAITAGTPALFVLQTVTDAKGNVVPAWKTFWGLFGASNQLLAALTLLGVTVWIWRTQQRRWVWYAVGLPTVFMYIMSAWALLRFVRSGFFLPDWSFKGIGGDAVSWAALVLIVLAALVLLEAIRVLFGNPSPPRAPQTEPAAVAQA